MLSKPIRADFVRANGSLNIQPTTLNRSGYWLKELELIEPSFYLRMDKSAPKRFAHALHERVLFENEMSKI